MVQRPSLTALHIVDEMTLQSMDITLYVGNLLTRLESNSSMMGYAWPTNQHRQPPSTCIYQRNFGGIAVMWCNIPQNQINNLILSMPRRCKALYCIVRRHTPC
ncbi:hypothetical protein AVEN_198822-1 [Araneus ventricosus]|uniref:Uncharacterized protein n=1 Tax=Araneus ventricosus TaxID=182803 RepID=A0A4Y2HT67_ARAVE|nr:hypothetical protein AVEN_198822-1 [Araneus ventricosus]